jgi:uncharacterized membrane protein YphA (DoxX/SURF4 family)
MSPAASPLKRGLYWFLRIFLAAFLLAAGIGKGLDIPGFIAVIKTYEMGLPEWALWPSAIGIILIEIGLGAWLLIGWRLSSAALTSAVLHAGYFLLLASALWRGLEISNCGCFGVFLARPLGWDTLAEDLVLIALSYALYRLAQP